MYKVSVLGNTININKIRHKNSYLFRHKSLEIKYIFNSNQIFSDFSDTEKITPSLILINAMKDIEI